MARHVLIDTCVVGAWSFSEEHTPSARKVPDEVAAQRIVWIAPDLFWAEFQQVCLKKRALGVPPRDIRAAYRQVLASPPIEIPEVLTTFRAEAWDYVQRLRTGSYDSYWLALADWLQVPLWTLDDSLVTAVQNDPSLASLTGDVRVLFPS